MKKKYFFTISIIILGILTLLKINVKNNNREKFFAEFGDKPIEKNIEDNLYD